MTILQPQLAIVDEFSALTDWEARYTRIIQIGRALPALAEEYKNETNKVRGCSSQVWLVATTRDGLIHFQADSDALIVRGLIALLLRVYSGQPADEIVNTEAMFVEELELSQHLSATRANGLAAMVARIKSEAVQVTKKS